MAADFLEETQLQTSDHCLRTVEWYRRRKELSRSGGLSYIYATVGYHRTKAGEFQQAIEMYKKAASIALRNCSYEETAQHIRSCISVDAEVNGIVTAIIGCKEADSMVFTDLKPNELCCEYDYKNFDSDAFDRSLKWLRLVGNSYREVSRWDLAYFYYRLCLCIAFELTCKSGLMEVTKFGLKNVVRKYSPGSGRIKSAKNLVSFEVADSIIAIKLSYFQKDSSSFAKSVSDVFMTFFQTLY